MEKINNIKIKNFKSLRDVEINDCRRVNVFIGYPNVGKSNILEAIGVYSLLHKGIIDRKSLKLFIRYSRFSDLFFNNDVKQEPSVLINNETNLVFNLLHLERLLIIFSGLSKKALETSNVKIRRGELYSIIKVTKNGTFAEDPQKAEIVKYADKPNIKKYTFNQDFKLKKSRNLSLNMPSGSNLSDIIEVDASLRSDINQMLRDYNMNLQFDRSNEKGEVELRKNLNDGTSVTINWELIADTLQRLFFYKAAISSNEDSVLLFEEPEAHMFPPYISKFTSDVILDKQNNQFFITTHSPFVLNDFMEDLDKEELAIYAVGYKQETGETIIYRMSREEMDEIYQYGIDLFFNLENYLKDAV